MQRLLHRLEFTNRNDLEIHFRPVVGIRQGLLAGECPLKRRPLRGLGLFFSPTGAEQGDGDSRRPLAEAKALQKTPDGFRLRIFVGLCWLLHFGTCLGRLGKFFREFAVNSGHFP
jgi:hypothetical protein